MVGRDLCLLRDRWRGKCMGPSTLSFVRSSRLPRLRLLRRPRHDLGAARRCASGLRVGPRNDRRRAGEQRGRMGQLCKTKPICIWPNWR